MYTRRLYRKTPPGYSGVLFGEGELPRAYEEPCALSPSQQKEHRRGVSDAPCEARFVIGRTLTAKEMRDEPIPVFSIAEASDRASDFDDELVLLGTVLFLLGTGLDRGSALVFIALLLLLT